MPQITETHLGVHKRGEPKLAKSIWSPCALCGRDTQHEVLAQVGQTSDTEDYNWTGYLTLQTVQCRGCQRCSFRMVSANSEDTFWDGEEVVHQEVVSLYPAPAGSRSPIREAWRVPEKVRRVYLETLKALEADLGVLAGVGIRALVEAVCKDQNTRDGNLYQRIEELVQQGLMPKPSARLLHGTRLLGNESAHEVIPLTPDAADAAVRVVEHLLETIYVVGGTAKDLPGVTP